MGTTVYPVLMDNLVLMESQVDEVKMPVVKRPFAETVVSTVLRK